MPPVAMFRRAGPLLAQLLTVLLFSVPVGVLASNDLAPHGVVGLVQASADSVASLHALLDALVA